MYLKIPLPRLDAGLLSAVFWALGLLLLTLAPGGLTGNWWWSVFAAGLALAGTAALLGRLAEAESVADDEQHLRVA